MAQATAPLTDTPLPKPEGLEGVIAASTALSHVFGEEGRLVYRGYDIHELAGNASFEEVAYLLWLGHLPSRDELASFMAQLEANNIPRFSPFRSARFQANPFLAIRSVLLLSE